jgi:predicted phage-related endonuclease
MKSVVRIQKDTDRRHFIGGSDARIIMGQDEKALVRLWQEKRGEVGPEDLSANLIVQLGVVTEDLNRVWYSALPPKCVFRFHINDMRCTSKHEKTRN